MKLVLLLFLALAIFATAEKAVSAPCQFNYNTPSGVITAAGSPDLDCIYNLSPPSDEYKFVTLRFTPFAIDYLNHWVTVYDGPSNSSELVAELSGILDQPVPTLSTSQPDSTIRFTTAGTTTSSGWTLHFQYHKQEAPVCAGPKWFTKLNGQVEYNLAGIDSNLIECQFIFTLDWNFVNNMQTENYLHLNLIDLEDDTSSALITAYAGASSYFPNAGTFSDYDDDSAHLWVPFHIGNLVTSSVSTFAGSSTRFQIEYGYLFEDNGYSSSSSCDDRHTWLWIAVALGCTTVVLVAVVVAIWRRYRSHNHKYQKVPMQSASGNVLSQTA